MVTEKTERPIAVGAMNSRVAMILVDEGVIAEDYDKYVTYSRQVLRLGRRGGARLSNEVELLTVRWKERGCRVDVLLAVRNEVLATARQSTP